MSCAQGEPARGAAEAEVDEVRWLPFDEAQALLSYDHDRRLVAGSQPGPLNT